MSLLPLDSSPDEKQALEQGIAALQAQRQSLGSAVVDVCVAVLRQHLAVRHEAAHQAGQQRKQVTVLFADISGYTAMSERMDAEDVNALMNQLWKRLDPTFRT
ncbi:MAG TPA: adenylate/guanylate cyclase domain-containing protein [Anaerolineales bacterium]|nr:adenylate/guanylate cyclase domain-containing protein [Anaerolineales bacterium]